MRAVIRCESTDTRCEIECSGFRPSVCARISKSIGYSYTNAIIWMAYPKNLGDRPIYIAREISRDICLIAGSEGMAII